MTGFGCSFASAVVVVVRGVLLTTSGTKINEVDDVVSIFTWYIVY